MNNHTSAVLSSIKNKWSVGMKTRSSKATILEVTIECQTAWTVKNFSPAIPSALKPFSQINFLAMFFHHTYSLS